MSIYRAFLKIVFLLLTMPVIAQQDGVPPLPDNLQVITPENASRLQEIGVLGRGTATALDWHPNGEVLAIGSSTGIWLLNQNLQIVEHTPIQQHIDDLAWSPDGTRIATVSYLRGRCTVQVWNGDFTAPEVALENCGKKILWNADGSYLKISNLNPFNNDILLIDVDKSEVMTLPGQDGVWSPSGNILFTRLGRSWTYSHTPTLYTWDVETKKPLFALDITDIQTEDILYGIDDRSLTIECRETEADTDLIRVGLCSLDARTGEITPKQAVMTYFLGQPSIELADAVWNEDETLLAWVDRSFMRGFLNFVFVMDGRTNEVTNIGNGMAFDWRPQTDELTAIVGNGEIRTYKVSTGTVLAESQWFTSSINMIAIRPNNEQIASTGFGYKQDTNIWDMQYSWTDPLLTFYVEPAEIVDYTPDGSELISGGTITTDIVANQQIDSFNPDSGEHIRNIASFYDQGSSPPKQYWNADYTDTLVLPDNIQIESGKFPTYITWSPDYSKIAIVEQLFDMDFTIRTWDTKMGEFVNQFHESMFVLEGLVWSPDTTRIAVLLRHFSPGSGNDAWGLRIFSVVYGQNYEYDQNDYQAFGVINSEDSYSKIKAAWNSDSTMIAVTLPDGLEVHDLQGDGTPLISLPAYEIVDLEWAADDRFIAGGSEDGTIRLWGVVD